MDPSCAIGFYCRTRNELDKLLLEIPKVRVPYLPLHLMWVKINDFHVNQVCVVFLQIHMHMISNRSCNCSQTDNVFLR